MDPDGTDERGSETVPAGEVGEGWYKRIKSWARGHLSHLVTLFIGGVIGGLGIFVLGIWHQSYKENQGLDALTREADGLMVSDKSVETQEALVIYKQAAQKIPREDRSLKYARVKRKIGHCYLRLSSEGEQPRAQLDSARMAFEESRQVYRNRGDASGVARVENDLARTHRRLANFIDREANLQLALELANRSSERLTPEDNNDYIWNNITLCQVHKRIAETVFDGNSSRHLHHALEAAKRALLKLPENVKNQPMRGEALACEGGTYLALSQRENQAENLDKALASYEEASEYSTLNNDALGFAQIQSDRGATLTYLAETRDKAVNLRKAIFAYTRSLESYPVGCTFQRAMTRSGLGEAYRLLAEVENTKVNLDKARMEYKLASSSLTAAEYQYPYAFVQANTGRVYRDLARAEKAPVHHHDAINHYRGALAVFEDRLYPAWHAQVQIDLGEEYLSLARLENKQTNLLEAWSCFKAAEQLLLRVQYEEQRQAVTVRLADLERRLQRSTDSEMLALLPL